MAADRITYHPRAEKKDQQYRKLLVGDIDQARGQYIARLDDQVTEVQVTSLQEDDRAN